MQTKGEKTSEYAIAKNAGAWGVASLVLGMIIQVGSMIAQGFGNETTIGIIVGACVSIAGILLKTLTSLGYIKSRTDVKVSEALKKK